MQLPNPHGSGASAPSTGPGGTAQRYTDPEQPASPLNVRVPTSPSSEGSRRPVLGNGGLFQGKGGCLGFGGNTVPVGPVEAFAQGSATVS